MSIGHPFTHLATTPHLRNYDWRRSAAASSNHRQALEKKTWSGGQDQRPEVVVTREGRRDLDQKKGKKG